MWCADVPARVYMHIGTNCILTTRDVYEVEMERPVVPSSPPPAEPLTNIIALLFFYLCERVRGLYAAHYISSRHFLYGLSGCLSAVMYSHFIFIPTLLSSPSFRW